MSTSSSAVAIPLFRAGLHPSSLCSGETVRRVWERSHDYEDEGSERRSLGAISIDAGTWWSASLTAPAARGSAVDPDVVFLRFERHGEAPAGSADRQADLALPRSEIDAFVTLLASLVDQARRDDVLTPRTP